MVNNCKLQDNWIQSTTLHNRTTEYSQNITQLDNRIKSTTVHYWRTEYSEQCSQLVNWVQSITGHNRTTVHNWTIEYSQQMYTTGQRNTVNKCLQQDYWIESTTVYNCIHLFLRHRLRGLVGKFAFFKLNTCWPLLPCRMTYWGGLAPGWTSVVGPFYFFSSSS